MIQKWKYQDNSEMQDTVIKDKSAADNKIIYDNKDSVWLNSLNKLQQVGWRVNKDVFNVIKEEPYPTKPEEDDEELMGKGITRR